MASMMAYQSANNSAVPDFLNKGDNAWQLTAATLVGMQSVPGLVILYGSMVKKKWAVNSAMMALYAYAMALVCWVMWGYKMSFGRQAMPILGIPEPAMTFGGLQKQAVFPAQNLTSASQFFFPEATMVYFQFVFAAISIILVAGSLLARMSFTAWAIFVPAWITMSYTVGAFSVWGGGFLYKMGVLDFSGGYVIHLSSGVAGFTAAYWVGPRLTADRVRFPPNNLILMLAGAGLVWGGWAGFNGGGPFAASTVASLAVLNTNVAAATSLLVWCALDAAVLGKPSSFGAVQGMVTGLVAITPGAGVVEPWGALLMGVASGSLPWFTMTVLHHRVRLLQLVDDTMGVFHTHAVAGSLGGLLTGVFATPVLCGHHSRGLLYGGHIVQVGRQLGAALFIIAWNVVVTSLIMLAIRAFTPLRMSDDLLRQGDEAVHGEEAFAFYDDLDDQQAGNNDKLDASL